MSLYDLFKIPSDCSAYDIETAGKSALSKINISNLKHFLSVNNIVYDEKDLPNLIQNMQQYVDCSACLLLEPATKDCYDNIINADTTEIQTLAKARISYLNAQTGYVKFDNSVLKSLPQAKDFTLTLKSQHNTIKPTLSCRWCRKPFELQKYMIYQCKCSARIGHVTCANKFNKEYKGKCPVCRSKLLKRYQISKYMFWGIDKKFKI